MPPASLTPRVRLLMLVNRTQMGGGGRGCPGVPDLSREGPFDVHHDCPHSGASPRLFDDRQGLSSG